MKAVKVKSTLSAGVVCCRGCEYQATDSEAYDAIIKRLLMHLDPSTFLIYMIYFLSQCHYLLILKCSASVKTHK